jgi:hypothetical protein
MWHAHFAASTDVNGDLLAPFKFADWCERITQYHGRVCDQSSQEG